VEAALLPEAVEAAAFFASAEAAEVGAVGVADDAFALC